MSDWLAAPEERIYVSVVQDTQCRDLLGAGTIKREFESNRKVVHYLRCFFLCVCILFAQLVLTASVTTSQSEPTTRPIKSTLTLCSTVVSFE